MASGPDKSSFLTSLLLHTILLLAIIVSAHFASPIPVLENTNKTDVISAVVLGDIAKSKIVPEKITPPPPLPIPPKVEPNIVQKSEPAPLKKNVIALEKPKVQKPIKKLIDKSKVADDIAKGLLEDIKQETHKRKQTKQAELKKQKMKNQKELASAFEKELLLQAERTLRQHLLEEDIRVKGERERQSQGEVNKFKALIIQAISENWIIPTQSNRKLSSELLIRLSPGGSVLDVQVTRSSGDPALDSSARAAVLKASPLPVPKDPEAFSAFKQFVLKVKPENIL